MECQWDVHGFLMKFPLNFNGISINKFNCDLWSQLTSVWDGTPTDRPTDRGPPTDRPWTSKTPLGRNGDLRAAMQAEIKAETYIIWQKRERYRRGREPKSAIFSAERVAEMARAERERYRRSVTGFGPRSVGRSECHPKHKVSCDQRSQSTILVRIPENPALGRDASNGDDKCT